MTNLELFASIMLIAKNDGGIYHRLRAGELAPEVAARWAESQYRRLRAEELREACRELRPAIAEALKTWAEGGQE